MDEKKKVINNKKVPVLILGIVLTVILAVIAWFFIPRGGNGKSPAEKVYEYVKRTVYTAVEPKDLGNPNDDVGYMLIDCDSKDMFRETTNISITNKEGKYVQGTGAFGRVSTLVDMGSGVFKEPVDISKFAEGSVHISLYVDNPSKMKREIWLELSSSGRMDDAEISWVIPKSVIQSGWNEFYLSIPDAYYTGTPDLTAINYYRTYELDSDYGVTIFYDNIYVTDTKGVAYSPQMPEVEPDRYAETTSPYGKMIMSCNTVNILKGISNAEVSTKSGTFVEGTGSFKIDFPTGAGSFVLKNPVDLTTYKDGYVHISLYVNDVSVLTQNFVLELTSSGTFDVEEAAFIIPYSELSNGWNHLWLAFDASVLTGTPDFKAINYLRIYGNEQIKGLEVYLDDVYASLDGKGDEYQETTVANGRMIASCNTINVFKSLMYAKVTTKEGEFVEGTGAMKSTSSMSTLFEGILKQPVDISAYESGYVHCSVYINDPTLLGEMLIMELTSSGKADEGEYAYRCQGAELKKGWNDLYYKTNEGIKTGSPDLSSINYIRFYCENKSENVSNRVFIVDNICAVTEKQDGYPETQVPNGKMITSCNTISIFSTLDYAEVTTKSREYVEGTGAFKALDYKGPIVTGILAKAIDVSGYAKGYVHASFYVNDTALLTESVALELSSSAQDDVDEYQWNIPKERFHNGWNELWLAFDSAAVYGQPKLEAIKRIRIYSSNRKEGIKTIVDNIYVSNSNLPASGTACDCGRPIYKGDIALGNCMCNFATAFNMKLTTQCVEGERALQAKNSEAGIYAKFKKAVDISGIEKGYIHIQLYVDNTSKLKNSISFEISSSGTYDKDEYAWEIPKKNLKNGWNEIWLPIQSAAVTGSPDLSAINYFRLYTAQPKSSLVLILDDVYGSAEK